MRYVTLYFSRRITSYNVCYTKLLRENQVEALRLVSGGRYDFTLASQLSGLYWVKKLGLSNITTVAEPFGEQRFCFAVKEGNEALLSRFSEGLAIVKSSGRYRVLYDKFV